MDSETNTPTSLPAGVVKVSWLKLLVRILAAPTMTSLGLILIFGLGYDRTGTAAYVLVLMLFCMPLVICLGGNVTVWVLARRQSEALRLGVLVISNLPLSLLSFWWSLNAFKQEPKTFVFFFVTPFLSVWTAYLLLERK
ncbi:hypothetical protein [Pseudomonas xanthosomatis]|uniref:hypothetical protein n=1 Tax=Pseudomonas xanthosomatis TaxID=2842356 RepID=UPI0035159A1D